MSGHRAWWAWAICGLWLGATAPADDRPLPREFRFAGYLPNYRAAQFDPAAADGITDLIVFSAEPTAAGELTLRRLGEFPWDKLRDWKTRQRVRLILCVGGWGRSSASGHVSDYRHEQATRKNNPPAIAAEGIVPVLPRARYEYNPHLPPVLRFDQRGGPDRLRELLEKAAREPLGPNEVRLLAEAIGRHEPWLEWAGKREPKWFEVDPVALHVHARVSTQAIGRIGRSTLRPPRYGTASLVCRRSRESFHVRIRQLEVT
jgi:hypothetical protein